MSMDQFLDYQRKLLKQFNDGQMSVRELEVLISLGRDLVKSRRSS
jgi:hypothetical protein